MLAMDRAALNAFLAAAFPQAQGMVVTRADAEGLELRLTPGPAHLRPGGTVSGPALFGLADVGVYLAILARIGPVALAVTTGGSIDFLRKPPADGAITATVRLLKLGQRLAVGDALLDAAGVDGPVARATLTYAIPPR